MVRPAAAVGTGTAALGATVAPSVPLPRAPAPVLAPVKALEPRKPKPFSGKGVAAQHGHVRRFLRVLTQHFELSKLPTDLWAPHARMYLEDSAAEHMDTAVQVLPITERDNWDKFCEILTSGFGTLDPDAEAWAKLRVLQQRKLSASEYVHQMRACFNGITVLPLSAGEKIERFLTGLDPELHRLVVTAPQGLGVNGKRLDPNSLMSYAVQQSQALACGSGKDAPATYLQVAANGFKKRPHMDVCRSSPARPANKKSNVKSGFRGKAELKWLGDNGRCYHCTEKGHRSSECAKKSSGVPASSMPSSYSTAGSAKEWSSGMIVSPPLGKL